MFVKILLVYELISPQTALLREVLTREKYQVLHFDLRIPGFADLPSLYMSLSTQMETYFQDIATKIDGYEDFEKESWSFKVRLHLCPVNFFK